jgi:hypothetical protein
VSDEEVRRRWQKLDEEPRAVADEIVRRALELREVSEDGLSTREAIELAADVVGRARVRHLERPAVGRLAISGSDSPGS